MEFSLGGIFVGGIFVDGIFLEPSHCKLLRQNHFLQWFTWSERKWLRSSSIIISSPPVLISYFTRPYKMTSIIKSKRGKDILVDKLNYMYVCNGDNKSGSVIYWECTKRRNASCLTSLHTKCRLDNFEIKQIKEHNHSSSKSDVAVKEAICNLKETAKNNKFEPTRSLVGDCLSTIDSTSKAEITNVKHLSRSVRKWKAEDRHHPEILTNVTRFRHPFKFQHH